MIRIEAQWPDQRGNPFSRLRAHMPEHLRRSLDASLAHGLEAAKARLAPGGGGPTSRSGRLAASLFARLSGSGARLQGAIASDAPYAAAQEYGAVIQAKRAAYLKFQVQGRWVQVKQVTLPARPFLGPGTQEAADELERLIMQAMLEDIS